MFTAHTTAYNIQDQVIDVWLCHSVPLQNRLEELFSLLSSAEQSRAERFKFALHKHRFIAFQGFMRMVLARYLNIAPENVKYRKGIKGKPYLDNPAIDQGLQFNLSHTGDLALLAVTKDAEIGIDIESMERNTDWQGVCRRFYTEAEQQALFSLTTNVEQQHAFYELWTRKEAYMKVLGSGLSLAPTDFTMSVPPQPPALIQHHSSKYSAPEQLQFRTLTLPDAWQNYCATFAVASAIDECHFYQFD